MSSPGTPGVLQLDDRTTTSIAVIGDTTDVSGSPFEEARFYLSGNIAGYVDASNNYPDSSGNGLDGSGNFHFKYTGLQPSTGYNLNWALKNNIGYGIDSSLINLRTLQVAPVPLTASNITNSSITVTGSDTSNNYSGWDARFFIFDSSGNSTVTDASGFNYIFDYTPDVSGNYDATFTGLSQITTYKFNHSFNSGNFLSEVSALQSFTTLQDPPGQPGPLQLDSKTSTSALVLGYIGNVSGSPFISATFYLDGSENAVLDASNNYPDSSGNDFDGSFFDHTLYGLQALTQYEVSWALTNSGGKGPDSSGLIFKTTQVAPVPLTSVITDSSIKVIGSDPSGTYPGWVARFLIFDQNNNPINIDGSGNNNIDDSSPDASGNYDATFNNLSRNTPYKFAYLFYDPSSNDSSDISALQTFTTTAICFLRGSRILCLNDGFKEEYIPIEEMKVGTLVKTLDGSFIKVHSIGSTTFNNPDNADRGPNRLFKLTVQNYPELTEDLIITGCHSRLVDKLLPHQKNRHLKLMKTLYMTTGKFRLMAFIDEKAEPYLSPGNHEIWHFALENKEVLCNYGVYANGGLLVETASIKTMTERGGLVLIE